MAMIDNKQFVSSGCIIINCKPTDENFIIPDDTSILLVHGRESGKFGFPKGHLEENETHWEAAKRELKEETGIIVDDFHLIWKHDSIIFFIVFMPGDIKISNNNIIDTEEIKGLKFMKIKDLHHLNRSEDWSKILFIRPTRSFLALTSSKERPTSYYNSIRMPTADEKKLYAG